MKIEHYCSTISFKQFGFVSDKDKASEKKTSKTLFLVCNHVTRRPCWWLIQKKFFCKICIKIEFISQRRETLLFLTTNMAAVTSLANQQFSARFCNRSTAAAALFIFIYIFLVTRLKFQKYPNSVKRCL